MPINLQLNIQRASAELIAEVRAGIVVDQWTMLRENFRGTWEGPAHWYFRGDEGMDWSTPGKALFPEIKVEFVTPTRGHWRSKNLATKPGGVTDSIYMRSEYNGAGDSWMSRGLGGRSSLQADPDAEKFGQEVNFFFQNARTKIVLFWKPVEGEWLLRTAGIAALRDATRAPHAPVRPHDQSVETFLQRVDGWNGITERLEPGPGPGEKVAQTGICKLGSDQYLINSEQGIVQDGVILSVPDKLTMARMPSWGSMQCSVRVIARFRPLNERETALESSKKQMHFDIDQW